ncbi:Intracellular sulfur oxidation protein DsrF [Halioglobus japonicus]|nr:Intracellular sulfur oxidation protein DsrF [Halioglobus japonicus]
MPGAEKRSVLVVMRHSPYGSSLAKAAVDVALAAGAFDQPVDLLFTGDGVLQLFPDQDSHSLGKKNMGRQLASLPMYDIDRVYVDAEAASRYNLDTATSPVEAKLLDPREMRQLMVGYDHLLGL